jgi:hypothetical protein
MATYISNQTGNWSSASTWLTAAVGTFSPTAAAGAPPQSLGYDKIVIRQGHTVTYDVDGAFGDGGLGVITGTNTLNILSAGMILSGGCLRASRTQSTNLTAIGMIWVAGDLAATTNSFFDWGSQYDPVSAVNATIHLSGAWNGYSGIYVRGGTTTTTSNSATFWGLEKTKNTFLTVSAAAGANQITVDDPYNWKVDDELVIESDTNNVTRSLSGIRIQSISDKTITISPTLNFDRLIGTRVGNFTSTVTYKSLDSLSGSTGYGIYIFGLANGIYQFGYMSMENINDGAYRTGSGSTAERHVALAACLHYAPQYNKVQAIFKGCSWKQVKPVTTALSFINIANSSSDPVLINDCLVYSSESIGSSRGFMMGANAIQKYTNCVVYRGFIALMFNTGYYGLVDNCYFNSSNTCVGGIGTSNGISVVINNSRLRTTGQLFQTDNLLDLKFNNCEVVLGSATPITLATTNAYGDTTLSNCTIINATSATYTINANTLTIKDADINIFNPNNSNAYINFNGYHYAESNNSTRKNGIASYSIRPKLAATSFMKTFSVPATQGVSQRIKGNIRFDSFYGTSNPPYLVFTNAVSDYTVTVPAIANIWHSFDIELTPNITGNIDMQIIGQSPSTTTAVGSGYVYIDGLILDPFIKDIRWYGFQFDKNFYRTVNTLTTLTENQVSALDVVTNLDYLYDAASYWSVTNPASSSYIDLFTVNGTVLDFGNRNFIINNTGTGFSYSSATNTITLDAPSLSAGTNFNTLKTTGTITLSTGVISNIDVNANLVQTTPTNLTGIYMLSSSNTLTYNTNTPIEVEYTNCTMVGVQNNGTAIVTIKRTNSTVTESDLQVETYAPTLIHLTLQGGYIALYDNTLTRQYFQNTDGTIVLPANATGNWSYKIARYGYQLVAGNFTVNPAIGGTIDIAPSYIPDTFINENSVSVVSAYTDLNTVSKIHDYLSYYLTTSEGIDYGILDSESFGVLSFYGNLVVSATANSIVDYNSGTNTLILKSTSLNDDTIFVVSSAFTQDGGNTIGDNLKIRATNIDSEFYFSNVNSITFYPTQSDRDNNTNAGPTATGTIYRFKYGSTVSGVTLSGFAYSRVTIDSILLLDASVINSGSNTIDFGTTGVLQSIIANQKIINTGVQKASKLIPHTTNV